GESHYADIRDTLRRTFGVPLPAGAPPKSYDRARHHAAFCGFLGFLKNNLALQTSVRVDASWASQAQILQGICQFGAPDIVLRAENLAAGLAQLSELTGKKPPPIAEPPPDTPFTLEDIYDDQIEAAVRSAYQRDYMMFGYSAWR
ncbi:MAG: nodulation protein NodH, partial [Halocynthiibacter sp.]